MMVAGLDLDEFWRGYQNAAWSQEVGAYYKKYLEPYNSLVLSKQFSGDYYTVTHYEPLTGHIPVTIVANTRKKTGPEKDQHDYNIPDDQNKRPRGSMLSLRQLTGVIRSGITKS